MERDTLEGRIASVLSGDWEHIALTRAVLEEWREMAAALQRQAESYYADHYEDSILSLGPNDY